MRRPWFGVLLVVTCGTAVSAQTATPPPLQRIVEKSLVVHRPAHACGSEPPWAVMKMGETAGVLTGAESLPGRCHAVPLHGSEVVQLQGLTVEAALNRIVEIDPRFAWRERNGVIVIRPVAAWTAADNPLNMEIPALSLRDGDVDEALGSFIASLRSQPAAARAANGDRNASLRRKFNVESAKGPAIDALDEIVRAHGALNWIVTFTAQPASPASMEVNASSFESVGMPARSRTPGQPADHELVDDPLQRIVDNDFDVQLPLQLCSVPATAGRIFKRHLVPGGIEYLPESCPSTPARGPSTPVVHLGGMTVAEALDKLVALDARFRWVNSNGLPILRPLTAWGDAKNVLNFTSTSFAVEDVNLDAAMSAVVSALQSRPREATGEGVRTNQGSKLFSVKTGPTSVGGALDAIIRAHGEGWWEVQHFRGGYGMRVLGFHTFDGSYIRSLIAGVAR